MVQLTRMHLAFLLITGIGWVALYASMDSEAKWGQVLDSFAVGSFWQGSPSRNGNSQNQSGKLGTDGRHNSVAGQPLHEQVQEDWLCRLQRRRVDGA